MIANAKFRDDEYQICSRCVMDTTDPDIIFDDSGVCNHCRYFDEKIAKILEESKSNVGAKKLAATVAEMKRVGEGKKYDCVIGISGGVDSTYVALKVKELGLRPLAVHFDSGWNSELAVGNIQNIVEALGIDLVTYVVDWEDMRDLQLSFFKASVPNCDIPTDHAFVAVLYRMARKYGLKHIIFGGNYATESILPSAWGFSARDLFHLNSIQRRFGSRKLKNYPKLGYLKQDIWYPKVLGIKAIRLLNMLPYDKKMAKQEIQEKLHWRDYGGKHFESIFTRFFQSYYLPRKFGFDKRRAHLASLILSGQVSREDALIELKREPHPENELLRDKAFVAKKLNISTDEFENILSRKNRKHVDYPNSRWVISLSKKTIFKKFIG